jgi:hypothetical protein
MPVNLLPDFLHRHQTIDAIKVKEVFKTRIISGIGSGVLVIMREVDSSRKMLGTVSRISAERNLKSKYINNY